MIVFKIFSTILSIANMLLGGLLIISAYSASLNGLNIPLITNSGLGFPILLLGFVLFNIILKLFFARKIKSLIIVLLIISPQLYKYSPYNFSQNIPKDSLKVVSYNVMGFDGVVKDESGENKILNYLKDSDADIICIQEYAEGHNKKHLQRKDIFKKLSAYPYHNIHAVGGRGSSNQLAIFSKHPILSSEPIHYKSAYNGSMAYVLNINGQKTLVLNNHFESNKITKQDKEAYEKILRLEENKDQLIKGTKGLLSKIIEASTIRQKQAEIVSEYIAKKDFEYVILCGDFNDSPLSYTNKVLEANLRNAFVESGSGLGISYNQNQFYFRIDNILISKSLKAYHCTVDDSIDESDHYPIWCYVSKR